MNNKNIKNSFVAVSQIQCSVKIFWQNHSIYDPKFWIPYEDEECDGLIFPEHSAGIGVIQNLTVQSIVLPKEGDILLSWNSDIILDPKTTDKMNCK